MTLNKKNAAIACGIIAVILFSYAIIVPSRQVASYKETAKVNQSKLNEKVNEVNEILDTDTFVKTEVETAQVHADVKKGLELIKDAENTLSLTEKQLTHISIAPGLGWSGTYKPVKDLRDNEQKYVNNTRAYLKELKSVLQYFEASANLDKDFEDAFTDLSTADLTAETDEDYAKQVDAVVAKIEKANKKLAAISVPESLKAGHDYDVAATDKVAQLLKNLSTAVSAHDYDQEDAISAEMASFVDEALIKSDEYNADFIRNSDLRKLDDKLNDLDRIIDRQITEL